MSRPLPYPCWPGPPCWPRLIDPEVMAEAEREERERLNERHCLACDRLLDPASYVGYMHNRRYCSGRCRRRAQRDREAARSGPPRPLTPELHAEIAAEMQAALDAWEAVLP